jgi:hypothetical protein
MASNRILKAAIAMTLLAGAQSASAAGIPVYCFNCQDATFNAAHSIIDAIRMQTEAQMNAADYQMRTELAVQTAIATADGVTKQRIENAYASDPSIAKPRLACAQTATANIRSGAKGAANTVRKALSKKSLQYNQRGANLPPGESRKEYSVTKVIEVLAKDDTDPTTVIDDAPIANDAQAIAKHRETRDAITNPYPVELPPEEEVKRIEKKGSQGEREGLSQMKVLAGRQQAAQFILDKDESNRIQYINSKTFKEQLDYYTESMDAETKKQWTTGKLSKYQVDELGYSYRALSQTWIKQQSASVSPIQLQKEQLLATAELLHQQGIANSLAYERNKLMAMKELREVSKDGLQTR